MEYKLNLNKLGYILFDCNGGSKMPKVLSCTYRESIVSATLSFDEVESEADNLDDLILDYRDRGIPLVVMENNTASPTVVEASKLYKRSKRRGGISSYSFPDNEYTTAPTLEDYLEDQYVCAAEIPVLGGVFIISNLENY